MLHFTFRNFEHFYTHPSLQMDHISCEVREAFQKMQDHHFDMEPSLMQIFFSRHSRPYFEALFHFLLLPKN